MSESPAGLAAAPADRYRVERELGQGNMATIYLAHAAPRPTRAASPDRNSGVPDSRAESGRSESTNGLKRLQLRDLLRALRHQGVPEVPLLL